MGRAEWGGPIAEVSSLAREECACCGHARYLHRRWSGLVQSTGQAVHDPSGCHARACLCPGFIAKASRSDLAFNWIGRRVLRLNIPPIPTAPSADERIAMDLMELSAPRVTALRGLGEE